MVLGLHPLCSKEGIFMGRAGRVCCVLVGAQAELAVFKPLTWVVTSPASEEGPCFGFIKPSLLLSHLVRSPG